MWHCNTMRHGDTKCFWLIKFMLCQNISILIGVVSFKMSLLLIKGYEGSLNDLMNVKMMLIMCHGLHTRQIPIQCNTYGRYFFLDWCVRKHCHPSTHRMREYLLEKGYTYLPVELQTTCSCSGSLWWPSSLLRHFIFVFFPSICHLGCLTSGAKYDCVYI